MDSGKAQAIRWHPFVDERTLRDAAVESIIASAQQAIRERGCFRIVLAGGNTPRGVYERLAATRSDWALWTVYFSDERCLPVADPERNSTMAAESWLDRVGIPVAQVHVMPAERGALEAACDYAQVLSGVSDFDLVLLGLGEDGHTASLFPGQVSGSEQDSPDVLAVFDAPKPPPQRVSLSAHRLGRARKVIFLVSGESKRRAVAEWRAGGQIPAAAIVPLSGVDVLLDSVLLEQDGDRRTPDSL